MAHYIMDKVRVMECQDCGEIGQWSYAGTWRNTINTTLHHDFQCKRCYSYTAVIEEKGRVIKP